jgi:hypothetical protein
MKSFLDYCTYSFKRNEEPPRAKSPSPETKYQCGNFACIAETTSISNWITAKYDKRFVYLCSQQCYIDWLDMPSHLGAWSPTIPKHDLNDPPEMKL